jgi:hypothetical protein
LLRACERGTGFEGNKRSPFGFAAVKSPCDERADTPSTTIVEGFHTAMELATCMVAQGGLFVSVETTGA